MGNTEGAGMRILALTNCLKTGPEVALGGGEVSHHLAQSCRSRIIAEYCWIQQQCERFAFTSRNVELHRPVSQFS